MVFPCPGADPCLNYHCKKGKVCELDEGNTPMCVCQDPSTCPPAEGEFEHVSGLSLDKIIQLSSFPWARPKTWSTVNIKPEMKHLVFPQNCGTDNKTYETSCHFFATKCALEGTKKGHKLHLDYIGPCKCEPTETITEDLTSCHNLSMYTGEKLKRTKLKDDICYYLPLEFLFYPYCFWSE